MIDTYKKQKTLLSKIVTDNSVLEDIPFVTAEMFTTKIFQEAFTICAGNYDNGKNCSFQELSSRLEGTFEHSVVVDFVREMVNANDYSVSLETASELVQNDYKCRKLAQMLEITRNLNPNNWEDIACRLQTDIDTLQDDKPNTIKSLAEIVLSCKDSYFTDKKEKGLKIGFNGLDDNLELEKGDVVAIGARPAVGKSAFVTQIADNLAQQGKRVGFYNLEMADKQMYERFVCRMSQIPLQRIKRAIAFQNDERERFEKANTLLAKSENLFISTGSKSIEDIRREVRHMKYDVLIIDYLQLIRVDRSTGNRYTDVGIISRGIKQIATDFNIPVIILTQLNRAVETRATKEPTLADIRESGDIEQDCSVVMFLWNTDDKDRTQKTLTVAKNRQGELRQLKLRFDGQIMTFFELENYTSNVKTESELKEAAYKQRYLKPQQAVSQTKPHFEGDIPFW